MTTLTFEDKEKKRLIKRFHTMLGHTGGGSNAKEAILHSYGVDSTRELSAAQLIEACNTLDKILNPKLGELDKWRKRVIASIGGWLRVMNIQENIAKNKAIACRAAKHEDYNDIPLEQLRSLYYAFTKKQKDINTVEMITNEKIGYLTLVN